MPLSPRSKRRGPTAKQPCEQCKDKHVKCDDERPACSRCRTRGLDCVRKTRPTSFRPGSSAQYDTKFTGDEHWVSGTATQFRIQQSHRVSRDSASADATASQGSPPDVSTEAVPVTTSESLVSDAKMDVPPTMDDGAVLDLAHSTRSADHVPMPSFSPPETTTTTHDVLARVAMHTSPTNSLTFAPSPAQLSPWVESHVLQGAEAIKYPEPLEDVREACLLRYYIENMSRWFDTCDEKRHFELYVPVWARHYPPLLHAILATSSRHLSRLPEYQTPRGIIYHGQLLRDVDQHYATEHMLACIPTLREFHQIQDKEHRELIVATALILRQCEEMEEDEDDILDAVSPADVSASGQSTRVNFLNIINEVIRSSHSEGSFDREGLFDVAYWISVRQEVYYGLTRGRSPKMLLAPEQWSTAATVNKAVMHAAQVAKWLFGSKTQEEWRRLKDQEALLDQHIGAQTQYTPILKRPPDKAKGEVFPAIWYSSDLVVMGIQHMLMAKMVLIAENPLISANTNPREANRQAESSVRRIVLELCGIGLHRVECPPTLVNAMIGIILYGDFFTDHWERQALSGVISRFRSFHAWPVPKALVSFQWS